MSFDRSANNIYSHPTESIKPLAAANMIMPKVSLASPMIERVHKSKPGCSACGKKVM